MSFLCLSQGASNSISAFSAVTRAFFCCSSSLQSLLKDAMSTVQDGSLVVGVLKTLGDEMFSCKQIHFKGCDGNLLEAGSFCDAMVGFDLRMQSAHPQLE